MGHAVNLVVSCSNRKRYETAPGLAAHELVGSDVRTRLQTWKKRLKDRKGRKISGRRTLYGGALVCRTRHSIGRDEIVAGMYDSGSARLAMASFDPRHASTPIRPPSRRRTDRFGCEWNRQAVKPLQSLVDRRLLLHNSRGTTLSPVLDGPSLDLSAYAADRRAFRRLLECS